MSNSLFYVHLYICQSVYIMIKPQYSTAVFVIFFNSTHTCPHRFDKTTDYALRIFVINGKTVSLSK